MDLTVSLYISRILFRNILFFFIGYLGFTKVSNKRAETVFNAFGVLRVVLRVVLKVEIRGGSLGCTPSTHP